MPGTAVALSVVYVASWCSFCCTVFRHSEVVNTIFGSGWSFVACGSHTHFPVRRAPLLFRLPRPECAAPATFVHSFARSQRPRTPAFGGRRHICRTLQIHNTHTLSKIGPLGNFLHSFARTHSHQRILVGAFMFHRQDPRNACEVWCMCKRNSYM